MADTTFRTILPSLKAKDNGDGTYSTAVAIRVGTGVATTFPKVLPPLKAVNLGDGTYAVAIVAI